jgi:serine/threonine protein kinase
MTSERWRQVEDLFHSTLDRAPRDRAVFLNAACADDRMLREQVEGLIESFDAAGDFIEKPLIEDSLSNASRRSESIVGHKIGNYEILSLIGAGGMGEVYLARDARLDRQIALKLLPAQFTADPAPQKHREILNSFPHRILQAALSRDNRWLFYSLEQTEADVWLLSPK